MIGQTLGHYRIVEKIGAGGMGEVYRARDERLERDVALKVLPEGTLADEAARKRFRKEALALSKLNHPNIATVHDFDTQDGVDFLVMEHVAGTTLAEKLKSGALPEKEVAQLGSQLASALEEAHEQHVVHRDLKPGNIALTVKGQVKVLDFGLAKLVQPLSQATTVDSLSETHGVAGTFPYMSPEQLRGESVDARSDIYAAGAVIYEMATGRRPFPETHGPRLISDIQHKPPPPPGRFNPEISSRLEEIILKCLEKDPEHRYQSAKELLVDLRRPTTAATAPVAHPVIAARIPWRTALAIAVAIVGTVLTLFLVTRDRQPAGIGVSGRPAIAVMYFEEHTGADETRWLSRGIPDMLLTGLAQTPGLDVVSSQRIHEILNEIGGEESEITDRSLVPEIARQSGAGAVVVGSVYKAGPEIRIEVQVEDVGSGRILSAHSVRGSDVFLLVDDLIDRIRASLDLTGTPDVRPVGEVTTASIEAYRLYSEGVEASRYFHLADARKLLEEAVRIDPSFAMAYFELSRIAESAEESEQLLAKVAEHLDRLPERDRLLAQAHHVYKQGETAQAIDLLEKLVGLYPDQEDAYFDLASIYDTDLGESEKALATLQLGVQAMPRSSILHMRYGYQLLFAGRYPEAIREFEADAQINPKEANPYDSLAEVYLVTGQLENALEQFARALQLDPSFLWSHNGRAWAYARGGHYDQAFDELSRFIDIAPRSGFVNAVLTGHFTKSFMLSRVGRYQAAEEEITRALRLSQRDSRSLSPVVLHALSAWLAIEREDYARALESTSRVQDALREAVNADAREKLTPLELGSQVAVHLLAGVAQARSGKLEAARTHLVSQKNLYNPRVPWQNWWHHALKGEIALVEGDLAAAEAAFSIGEPELKMRFLRAQSIKSIFANNLPFRDGLARVRKARGDLAGAIETYRMLITPDSGSKWVAMLEPRYVLELARLLDQTGDKDAGREQYRLFFELWKDADPDLSILQQAQAEYAKLQESLARAPGN